MAMKGLMLLNLMTNLMSNLMIDIFVINIIFMCFSLFPVVFSKHLKTHKILQVKRQEDLLQKCKESIRNYKEKTLQLASEKQELLARLQGKVGSVLSSASSIKGLRY